MVQKCSSKAPGEFGSSDSRVSPTRAIGSSRSFFASAGQLPDVSQKRKLKVVDILEGFMFQVSSCEHLVVPAEFCLNF